MFDGGFGVGDGGVAKGDDLVVGRDGEAREMCELAPGARGGG